MEGAPWGDPISFIHSFNKVNTMCCVKRRSLWGILFTELNDPLGRAEITAAPASKGLGSGETGLNSKGNMVQEVTEKRCPLGCGEPTGEGDVS